MTNSVRPVTSDGRPAIPLIGRQDILRKNFTLLGILTVGAAPCRKPTR
jgi:hypothetical protein